MGSLILHIGVDKTGTSTLQHYLSNNQGQLDQLGVAYPTAFRPHVAHHPLAHALTGRIRARLGLARLRRSDGFSALKEQIDSAIASQNVLLSSEAFCLSHFPLVRRLFTDYPVKVVIYLREQSAYLLSAYAQHIHANKSTVSLDEFERKTFNANYLKLLGRLESTFGRQQLTIRIYDRKQLVANNIIDDFLLNGLGIDRAAVANEAGIPDDLNPTLPWRLVQFKRMALLSGDLVDLEQRQLYRVLKSMAASGEFDGRLQLSAALFERIRRKYGSSNQQVDQRYLDGLTLELNKDVVNAENQHLDDTEYSRILERFNQAVTSNSTTPRSP